MLDTVCSPESLTPTLSRRERGRMLMFRKTRFALGKLNCVNMNVFSQTAEIHEPNLRRRYEMAKKESFCTFGADSLPC